MSDSLLTLASLAGLKIDIAKIIPQLIAFGILYYALSKYAFKPLLTTMDERTRKIEDGLKYAEQMKARLAEAESVREEKLKAASEEAARIIAEARSNAKAFYDNETQSAVSKAQEILAKAHQSIELERKQMLLEVRREAASLVLLTSAAVLKRDLTPEERSRFSDSAVRELARN